jgi:hypothetical protein
MGYFDALTSPYFRTARDGRRLFFPPSIPGRGYVIGSEQAFERLQRQVKRYAAGSLVLIFGSGLFVSYLASFVIAALLVPVSIIGARYLTRGMQPSEEKPEKLSWYESFASQARAHSAESLWWLEICSLAFVCGGIFVFVVNPDKRPVALASIAFFGLGAVIFAFQLFQRNLEIPDRTRRDG